MLLVCNILGDKSGIIVGRLGKRVKKVTDETLIP